MIHVNNLSRHYGNFKAVDTVSFEIQPGEVVGLLGHNGAGKTTIMKMITGYLEPTSGDIHIDNLDISKNTRAIQKRIGYLPENCPVWPEMTVIDYLEYQASLHGVPKGKQSKAVARAIQRTSLVDKATASIQTLSRGLRQRVGVAQAILHEPDIIILDEPTNGLDPTQIRQMRELIRELAQTATVIISTHILQEVQAVCERVLIMRGGELAVDEKLDELQSGQHLLLTLDTHKASDYLLQLNGVKEIKSIELTNDHATYVLEADADLASGVAAAVLEKGDKLFSIQPEKRNLETVFADVNSGDFKINSDTHSNKQPQPVSA